MHDFVCPEFALGVRCRRGGTVPGRLVPAAHVGAGSRRAGWCRRLMSGPDRAGQVGAGQVGAGRIALGLPTAGGTAIALGASRHMRASWKTTIRAQAWAESDRLTHTRVGGTGQAHPDPRQHHRPDEPARLTGVGVVGHTPCASVRPPGRILPARRCGACASDRLRTVA